MIPPYELMNCQTVEEMLLDFVEGELDEEQAQALQSHVDGCAACRRNVKETRDLFEAMEDVRRRQEQSWQTTGHGESPAAGVEPIAWRPGRVLGDFEILGEIGHGGMGIVYRARQVSLNRVVALKVLPGTVCQSKKAIARFTKEAQAAARLHHTNIVPVYAQGDHEGHFYYAMELIDGKGLDRALQENPSMIVPRWTGSTTRTGVPQPADSVRRTLGPEPDAAAGSLRADYHRLALLVAGVAEGLEHAHQQGVVHRDIKPQNLLLGADGQLHIVDFGLARLLDEPSVTVTGEMLGTPAYMSPEQVSADRKKIDHRTDIYSLGVTFYELLARRRPFLGASREQIIARICTDEPRPPRKWRADIPVDLETICLRAMEKDQRRRYQSAGDMAVDLRRYAADRPILSRRVGQIEKAIKWVRRHRAITTIIGLSLALVVVASVFTIQAIEARHARASELVNRAFDTLAYEDYRAPERARLWLAQAEPLGPDETAYDKAFALAHLLDDPKLAISRLEQALLRRPDDAETMYLLAWSLRRDQQNRRSHEWISRAEAVSGATTAAGHFFHAQAVVRNNPEEAVAAYRKAYNLRENYTQAYVHLGRALNHWMYHHRKHEWFSEQKNALQSACVLQANKAYPRYLLSIAYRLSAEIYEHAGDQDAADEHFRLALLYAKEAQHLEPDSPHGYACEAEYWEARKDCSNAIAAWDRGAQCCDTPSSQVELHQYRWRLRYWDGQLAEAMEDLDALRRDCPDSDVRKIWYAAALPALIHAEMGRMEEALQLARSMAASEPTDFRAVTSSACMLRILGHGDEADRVLAGHAGEIDFDVFDGESCAESPPGWINATYALCRGHRTLQDLEQLAGDRRGDKLLWPAAYFFAAAEDLGRGDRRQALGHLRRCERTFDYDDYSYLAKVFVRKLDGDPTWPNWLP
ncbi:MAG: protein kinase [Phycisphaerae bacterium]|nr:protein kinase [Phycisphaerae bacterium]